MGERTRLLQREDEVRLLLALADDASVGRGGVAIVTGAPGLGKTALLQRMIDTVEGVEVLRATAGELEDRAPFGVVRRLLARAVLGLPDAERTRLADGPARPAVDLVLGAPGVHADQALVLHGLAMLVESLAERSALLVVVDDAQWADEDSLLFLLHLAPHLAALRVLVVLGVRDHLPDRRGPALAGLFAHRSARFLPLAALTERSIGMLLGTDEPEVVRRASVATGGNPFLTVALAGLLESSPGTDPLDAIPASVIASVTHRLSALPVGDRELAASLAVLVSAPTRIAARVAGLSVADAAAASDRMRDAGLLASGDRLEFRHALLQSAVLSASGPAAVEQRRRRAASVLAAESDAPSEAAAQLMRTSGVADPDAVEILRRAADEALAAGSPSIAVDLLQRAVAEPPSAERLPAVLLALGEARLRMADAAGLDPLQRAFDLANDPITRAEAAIGLSAAWNVAGAYPRAADALERALDDLARIAEPDDSARELALFVEAALVATARQVPERIEHARARLSARPHLIGATPGERMFLSAQVFDAVGTNQPRAEVHRLARAALSGEVSTGLRAQVERHARDMARLTLLPAGYLDEALAIAEDAIAAGLAQGSAWEAVAGHYARALARHAAGDLAGAETDLRYMLRTAGDGTDFGRRMGTAALVDVLIDRGDLDAARASASTVDDTDLSAAGYSGALPLLRSLASLELHDGHPQLALDLAERCGRQAVDLRYDAPGWCSWRSVAVPALRELGDPVRARALAEQELDLVERAGSPVAIGAAMRMLGELRGDTDRLRAAVALLAESGARVEHSRALVSLGAALRRAGARVEAREFLAQGRDLARRCGAAPLVTRAEHELAAAGARRPALSTTGPGALTMSERRACELAAAGASNRVIAQSLFISTKTVETHLSRSYRKLGIAGRGEIAEALLG